MVDVAWGIAFAGVSVVSAAAGTGDTTRRWLLAALICVWGLRLAAYSGIRSRGHGEDPATKHCWGKSKRTRLVAVVTRVYLLQGALIWFISLPVQLSAALPQGLSWWGAVGLALWLLGLTFEAVGDAQLRAFKRRPENRGSRHDAGPVALYTPSQLFRRLLSVVGLVFHRASPAARNYF